MASPTPWSAPTSTPTSGTAHTSLGLGYTSGGWAAPVINAPAGTAYGVIWYATDPTGTWTAATVTAPVGYSFPSGRGAVVGGNVAYATAVHAVALPITDGVNYKTGIYYASSLGTAWSSVVVDVDPGDFIYADGKWVVVGQTPSASGARMSYATSITGTWSNIDSTGRYSSIAYNGSEWLRLNIPSASVDYATSLTGTWTATSWSRANTYPRQVTYGNGYWAIASDDTSLSNALISYASSASGTWTFGTVLTGASGWDVAYDQGAWVVACSTGKLRYNESTPPSGSWSIPTVSGISTSASFTQVVSGGGYLVAITDGNLSAGIQIRYVARPVPPAATPTNTFLRLHQSPVMTPSRPRGPYLRQRQRPNLT